MTNETRANTWQQLDQQEWDLIIVGGGITGAGILREAVRLGLKALLVEQKDFAWGTSSRSSKLVHGGLRYLKEGRIGLTRDSVKEREQLMADGPGLIDPLGFLLMSYEGDSSHKSIYRVGLTVYDLLALQWSHRHYSPREMQMLAPHLATEGLKGGFRYGDAQTDDARLVLRVIQEAEAAGGTAFNYVRAETLLRDIDGQVTGIQLHDLTTDQRLNVLAKTVVNATGAWADKLRAQVGAADKIRPLRGSHLVFSQWRLPAAQAISFLHPIDRRPVFAFPWEGATLVGTTDVDFDGILSDEPTISPDEVAYLMTAVASQFPSRNLMLEDVISTFAGVRPVIGSGKEDPSEESRDHIVLIEDGLITVTGGKLTTFRLIALDVLEEARLFLPDMPEINRDMPVLDQIDMQLDDSLDETARRRLLGRYGANAQALVSAAQPDELRSIRQTPFLWAELRWAARHENVQHLDDLLLRRVRVGLLLPQGGLAQIDRIRLICQPELGWDDARWDEEVAAYAALWQAHYSLPDRALIPDWREQLMEKRREEEATAVAKPPTPSPRPYFIASVLALVAVGLAWWFWRD